MARAWQYHKSFILSGERGRNRTYNLLIKSQLLCQLSYAPYVTYYLHLATDLLHVGFLGLWGILRGLQPASPRSVHPIARKRSQESPVTGGRAVVKQ
jgi:hypothetical protein